MRMNEDDSSSPPSPTMPLSGMPRPCLRNMLLIGPARPTVACRSSQAKARTEPEVFRSVLARTARCWSVAMPGREQRDLIAVLQQRGLWQTNGRASGITFNHRQRIVEEPAEALKRSAAALRSGRRRTRPRERPSLSTSGLRSLHLPCDVRDVIVLCSPAATNPAKRRPKMARDASGAKGVRITRPPNGMDFNDPLRFGWGTWIRTKIDGVRVRCSTVELSPNGRQGPRHRAWARRGQ